MSDKSNKGNKSGNAPVNAPVNPTVTPAPTDAPVNPTATVAEVAGQKRGQKSIEQLEKDAGADGVKTAEQLVKDHPHVVLVLAARKSSLRNKASKIKGIDSVISHLSEDDAALMPKLLEKATAAAQIKLAA